MIGSPKGAIGYRLRERADCVILPYRDRSAIEQHEAERRREHEHLIKTMDFEEQTDRRINKKKVWSHVRQGIRPEVSVTGVRGWTRCKLVRHRRFRIFLLVRSSVRLSFAVFLGFVDQGMIG